MSEIWMTLSGSRWGKSSFMDSKPPASSLFFVCSISCSNLTAKEFTFWICSLIRSFSFMSMSRFWSMSTRRIYSSLTAYLHILLQLLLYVFCRLHCSQVRAERGDSLHVFAQINHKSWHHHWDVLPLLQFVNHWLKHKRVLNILRFKILYQPLLRVKLVHVVIHHRY